MSQIDWKTVEAEVKYLYTTYLYTFLVARELQIMIGETNKITFTY